MPTLPTGNNTAGFTLLELLVVLAIMAAVGTLAYPLVRPAKYDGRVAATKLLHDIEALRDKAAADGTPLHIRQEVRVDGWKVWPLPLTPETEALDDRFTVTLPDTLKIYEIISPLGRQDSVALTLYPDASTDPYVLVLAEADSARRWRLTFNGTVQRGRLLAEGR
jgi:prepilin-type N-terminal cleavage/methylation domain-containing protein